MRKLRFLALLALAALSLTACMRVDMNLTIEADDTLDGTMSIAFNKKLMEDAGITPEQVLENENLFGGSDATGVDVSDFTEGDYAGKTYTFTDVTLAEFTQNLGSAESSFDINRVGDELRTSGLIDLSKGTEELNAETKKLLEELQLTIQITYPGTITRSTGAIDGNTVSWTVGFGDVVDVDTVVESPKAAPAAASTSAGTGPFAFVGLAALLGVLAWIVYRKKS